MRFISLVFLLAAAGFPLMAQQATFFLSSPAISPDGQTVVFCYENDLWRVPATGGEAHRLTAMDGDESNPAISPDGKWLAFTSNQFGSPDVYVMPLEGGQIRQLTFHEADDQVESWSWDSQTVYFTSNRANRFTAFSVPVAGGTPKRLFPHYFITAHNIFPHPHTGELFFSETWESKMFAHRKRYKGAYNPDIMSYNPGTKETKRYTDYEGKDLWAATDSAGTLYFASDEANGEYNLYTIANGTKTPLTRFDTSIGRPSVSAGGGIIAFEKDYQLFVYETAAGQARKLSVRMPVNPTTGKEQDFEVQGNISAFDVSPDNKKLAFVSRGMLFVSDLEGKFVRHIASDKGERVTEVKWLNDNRSLLAAQTVDGYTQLFTVPANGSGSFRQLTQGPQNRRQLVLDPKLERAAYLSGREEVCLLDLATFQSKTIAKAELWAIYNPDPAFSPDGQYLLFTARHNFEEDVMACHLPTGQLHNLTNTGVTETGPVFSPDGKYVVFTSDRNKPSYPYGLEQAKIYRMALDRFDAPFRADKFQELFKEMQEKEGEGKDKKGGKTEGNTKNPAVHIRFDGLMDRLERIGPAAGSQNGISVLEKDGKTYYLYASNHDEGKPGLWVSIYEDFKPVKTEKISGADTRSYALASAKDSHYLLFGGNIHKYSLTGNSAERISISHTFRKNLGQEFRQMYYEAWAGLEENFYSSDFHGQDWGKLRDRYAEFLPHVASRANLRQLFADMLGELNASHLGFMSSGKEEKVFYGSRTMDTGILYDENSPYTVKGIVKAGPADKTGIDLRPGDRLVAVNSEKVDEQLNREFYFSKPSVDEETSLVFSRNGALFTVNLHPAPYTSVRNLHYEAWIDGNQRFVDEKSDKRIAYIHMKDMSGSELERFKQEMVSEAQQRDALILDLRYNTGGNVHDEVLQFLSQRPYLQWKYRGGQMSPQPHFAPAAKPIVLLINEQSLSDAEMTAAGFKTLGLGKVVGTETYRWIIFTSGKSLVDGSFYRIPGWGCFSLDGKNLELEGVAPDIEVPETFADRLEGHQPQLLRAMEEIGKMLKKEP